MFHSARWKAYLQKLQDNPDSNDDISNLYHALHSEKLWNTVEEKNGHQKEAEQHLQRSDELMKDCTEKVDALEETLANTPKPSEMLDWNSVTLGDLG